MNESDQAKLLAEKILDFDVRFPMTLYVHGDPDCDACVLARQYLRLREADDSIFQPTEATKTLWKSKMVSLLPHDLVDEFFALWETEKDARKAGSLVAHRIMVWAARIALFGAQCSGVEPKLENWLAASRERFDEAQIDVASAFKQAAEEESADQ